MLSPPSSTVAGAVDPTDSATPSDASTQPAEPSPSQSAEPTVFPSPPDGPSLSEEEKYWTAERMANAVPVDDPPDPAPAASKHGITAGAAAHRPPPSGTPTPEHFLGHPMVGTFFFDGKPLGGPKTYCTGSVVHTGAKDIVLTAGHCGLGLKSATHRIFVPRYRIGRPAAEQPDGVFPVSRLYIDPRYERNSKKAVSDLDLAFAQVGPNSRGKVEDVTGALTFTPTSSYHHKVTVIGYPDDAGVNPDHVPVRCPVSTSQLPGFRQMRMTCTGFYGGVSGGPWIEDHNSTNGTGKVIGNTGGYNGGGNDADDDWVTYAPIYGKDAQDLFADAAAHRKVDDDKPPYQPSGDPWLPGAATTWQHADLMASGDFRQTGHSDMIVVWSDGEVTLYPGNGHGGYDPERQLLDNYAGTTTSGLGGEHRILDPNGLWKHDAAMTTGDFTGNGRTDDLVIRWSDGETTMYTDTLADRLGTERMLVAPTS
ncbi:trypsin-like serine peptidase [Streptomyces sp. NPDC002742]|uniref:trypsin-like serine peptidase n=1 Tax=Streptomyces sp. NPDC002742 TaxID=3364663 RepID=UPI00368A1C1B